MFVAGEFGADAVDGEHLFPIVRWGELWRFRSECR
jgi:hypothetical protein